MEGAVLRHRGVCGVPLVSAIILAMVIMISACTLLPPTLVGEPAPSASNYLIGPGDTVNVFVYRSPELSAEVPVRPDGRISTPLAPGVAALGRTPSQLARAIEAELGKYVKEPTVTVMVTGFIGPADRQIRVIGEVAQPSALPYRAQLSILD